MLKITAFFPYLSAKATFNHFTQEKLLQRWWAPVAGIEPRVGGAYRLSWPEHGWCMNGRIVTWVQGKELALTWAWEHQPTAPYRQVELRFEACKKGTQLQLPQGPYAETPEEDAWREEHLQGWTYFLEQPRQMQR